MRYLSNEHIQRKKQQRALLAVNPINKTVIPKSFSLRAKCPVAYDQGDLGSCTANAICGAIKLLNPEENPSRLFVYYGELKKENPTGELSDTGADPMDGCVLLTEKGVCSEATWPYDISKFTIPPPATAYEEALKHKSHVAKRVNRDLQSIKATLASGSPILTGISVYQSFESEAVAKTGTVPLPKHGEPCLGGHEILMVGFDDATKKFTFLNSWGETWGDKGFFTLPYTYIQNPTLADDFIIIDRVE